MMRLAFEGFCKPGWPIDLGIYSVPLKIAYFMKIPLIVYGENTAYEYGGPYAEDTYSAKNQIYNNVANDIDWNWWFKQGITEDEISFIRYPTKEMVDELEPIYLSYFYEWDGRHNYEIAKIFGFKDLGDTWHRDGFIENYDQIDSIGYLVHAWLKYPKFGHARVTDVACYWIRNGYMTREEGMELVNKHDHKLDQRILDDFLNVAGYSAKEFWDILDKFWNRDIFEKKKELWKMKIA